MRLSWGVSLLWMGLAVTIVLTVWFNWDRGRAVRSAEPIFECQQLYQQCHRDCSDMFPYAQSPDYAPEIEKCDAQSRQACLKHEQICARLTPAASPDS